MIEQYDDFPPLFPVWYIQDPALIKTPGSVQTHFGGCKSQWMLSSGSGPCSYIHIYVYMGLCTATQMFNGSTFLSLEKLAKKTEKKKWTSAHGFCCLITDGPRSQEYLYFHSHFKGKQFPKSFALLCSANDGNRLSLKEVPPDMVVSLLTSQLEAFPEQRLEVALNRAEMVVLALNRLLSLGADLKNKLLLTEIQVSPERQMERRKVFYKEESSFTMMLPTI